MIWPYAVGQPYRTKHWQIFFEPVLDEKSNPIPSTFVIVFFIPRCCGGVFTEERKEPGLFTGPIYLVAALSHHNSQKDARLSPDILSIRAIELLERVQDASTAQADMFHTAHITLTTHHLGYNLSGNIIKQDIDKNSVQRAQASIMAVKKTVYDGNSLTGYREIWFISAESIFYIRHSQLEKEKQNKRLKTAFKFSKKAKNLAKDSGHEEIVCWADNLSEQVYIAQKTCRKRETRM